MAKKKAAKRKVSKKKVNKKKVDKKAKETCFVLMPFREPFDTYYNAIIEPAVTKAGLQAMKGDSLFLPTPIIGDIWGMIQDAKILVAVLTGKNANVFYELGLGHAIGKPIILVSETMDDVPFDLQALRVILYDKDHPKWGDKLRSDITNALKATTTQPIDAVPTMFRKKVKSQAPQDSEVSMRLASLEREVASLQERPVSTQKSYEIPSAREAELLIRKLLSAKLSPNFILETLVERGFPRGLVSDTIRRFQHLNK